MPPQKPIVSAVMAGDHFTKFFSIIIQMWSKFLLLSHLDFNKAIITKFCTWQENVVAVACTKICWDLMISIWITARLSGHRIWIANRKSVVKCAPNFTVEATTGNVSDSTDSTLTAKIIYQNQRNKCEMFLHFLKFKHFVTTKLFYQPFWHEMR